MKNPLRKLAVFFTLLFPLFAVALAPAQRVSLIKVCASDIDDEIEVTEKRHRLPSAPIECVITADGIYVQDPSINLAEAILYEVWDVDGEMSLAAYPDETSFIDGLFSLSGEYQIRFVFTEYVLVGNIML